MLQTKPSPTLKKKGDKNVLTVATHDLFLAVKRQIHHHKSFLSSFQETFKAAIDPINQFIAASHQSTPNIPHPRPRLHLFLPLCPAGTASRSFRRRAANRDARPLWPGGDRDTWAPGRDGEDVGGAFSTKRAFLSCDPTRPARGAPA